jgi:hypothetical protein
MAGSVSSRANGGPDGEPGRLQVGSDLQRGDREPGMECVCCGSAAVTERRDRTAQGYRRFHCRSRGTSSSIRLVSVVTALQHEQDAGQRRACRNRRAPALLRCPFRRQQCARINQSSSETRGDRILPHQSTPFSVQGLRKAFLSSFGAQSMDRALIGAHHDSQPIRHRARVPGGAGRADRPAARARVAHLCAVAPALPRPQTRAILGAPVARAGELCVLRRGVEGVAGCLGGSRKRWDTAP